MSVYCACQHLRSWAGDEFAALGDLCLCDSRQFDYSGFSDNGFDSFLAFVTITSIKVNEIPLPYDTQVNIFISFCNDPVFPRF